MVVFNSGRADPEFRQIWFHMQSKLRSLVRALIGVDLIWRMISPFIKLAGFISFQRTLVEQQRSLSYSEDEIKRIFKDLVVKNGPFAGMRYPDFDSCGSTLYPKLLGSYENELNDVLKHILSQNYSRILDVGCAEGYYAVGLALRLPKVKVVAFDIDARSRALCHAMAKLNKVEEIVEVRSSCTAELLAAFPFKERTLIISDCEGFEKKLFTAGNVANLKNCDLLIETHDFVDMSISPYLHDLFKATHDIQCIQSVDDIIKAKTYSFKETEMLPLPMKRKIFAEGRPSIMEWLFLKSKASA